MKIKETHKKELIDLYESSNGMSGIASDDINKEYVLIDYSGSNIRAHQKDNINIIVSLNYSRFECQDSKKHIK